MDDEKILKQKLLKTEIIDHSYDQSEFIEFCLQKKKDGDDINNWTYEELKNIIKEFITKTNHNYLQEKKVKEIQKKSNEEKEKNDILIDNNELLLDEIKDKNEEKIIKIKCKELKKNILNEQNIYIKLENSIFIKSNNILSNNSYWEYEIITSNRQKDSKDKIFFKVQRKYSDFLQLREILAKFFPYNYIPSLQKKSQNYLLNKENQQKIISYLNIFINSIISKEEFKAFEGTFLFLTISDYDEYKNKIKEISSIQPPLNVNELPDFKKEKVFLYIDENDYDNEISIEENKNEIYFFNIKNYFEIQYNLITQLKGHLKEFTFNLQNSNIILDKIEQDFSYLSQLNKKVMMKEKIEKSFEEMGHFFEGWKQLISKQTALVKKNINTFYKYCLNESLSYLSLIKKRENIKNLYINEYKKLDAKKEKMWKYEDIKKWGINYEKNKNFDIDNVKLLKDKKYAKKKMLYKESLELEIIKDNFGYINYMNKKELDYFLDNYLSGFKVFIMNFVKEFYPTLNDFTNYWSNLSVFVN